MSTDQEKNIPMIMDAAEAAVIFSVGRTPDNALIRSG